MRYRLTVKFKDGRWVDANSENKIDTFEAIEGARQLMKSAGLDGDQPIVKVKNKKKFLFFYI